MTELNRSDIMRFMGFGEIAQRLTIAESAFLLHTFFHIDLELSAFIDIGFREETLCHVKACSSLQERPSENFLRQEQQ